MSPWTRGDIDPALDAWMAAGAGSGAPPRACHETPIAKVYVFEDRVLKLKKPVDFGFLDFSTLDKREWATRRELEFNGRTAPEIYRAVHAVTRGPEGFRLEAADEMPEGGPRGGIVDWALEMAPFDSQSILANHPEQVDGDMAERLGREIAHEQAGAPLRPVGRGAAGLGYVLNSNAEQLRSLESAFGVEPVERLLADSRAAFERHAGLLDRRRDAGFVRRCHGDLHLGNIMVEDGKPTPFDCIEFSDVLGEIDVMYDTAFLLMDLAFRGRGAAANRVLNAWLDQSARCFGSERFEGLAALPLFLSVRAAVRAHVTGHDGDPQVARRYVEAAQAHLAGPKPVLYALGGLSGSGKSTLARRVAVKLGPAPGAVILRTDEIRKRLWNAAPTEPLPKAAYAPEQSERVYGLMLQEARAALEAGWPVILDAAFLKPGQRDAAAALAQAVGVSFQGLWLEAPAEVLRERVRGRSGDASDADEAVLEGQLAKDLGHIDWRRIDATTQSEDQLADALRA
jgi:aminoglycoside phosphotransferase family enzyme/predicted kinase